MPSDFLLILTNYMFLVLVLFAIISLQSNRKLQLVVITILSLILLSLPSFFFPNYILPESIGYIILSVLSIYPIILIFLKLKYDKFFNKAKKYLVAFTGVLLAFYIYEIYSGILYIFAVRYGSIPSNPYNPYETTDWPLYLIYVLILALPEFIAIFVENIRMIARIIIAYESVLGLLVFAFYLPFINSTIATYKSVLSSLIFRFYLPFIIFLGLFIFAPIVTAFLSAYSLAFVALAKKKASIERKLITLHLLLSLFVGSFVVLTAYLIIVGPGYF